jgi:hypothetical protein
LVVIEFKMPKFKRGSGWKLKKEHRPVSSNAIGRPKTIAAKAVKVPIQQLVQMLWCEDYWQLIDKILDADPDLHEQLLAHLKQHQSRYTERLSDEKLGLYLQRQKFKLANVMQSLLALGHASSGTDCLKLIKSMVRLACESMRTHSCGNQKLSQALVWEDKPL